MNEENGVPVEAPRSGQDRAERRYQGSLLFPLVLIALGVVFLLSNLGVIAGDPWGLIFSLWPLLLIAMGLDAILRREGLVGAALLIGLGTVFLLNNLGYLAFNPWDTILRLWPVLLIAVGFDLVVGRRSLVLSLVGLVLVLGILAVSLYLTGIRFGPGTALQGRQVSQALEGASEARVILEPGAGTLLLDALSESDALIEGQVGSGSGGQVVTDFDQAGDSATYTLRHSGNVGAFIPVPDNRWVWDLGLNPEVPLDLQVDLGAGDAELDLRELDLISLNVDLGIGQAEVYLPAQGRYDVRVSGGIGQLVVIVPEGLGVTLQTDTGLGGLSVPDSWTRRGDDEYISPDSGGADAQAFVDVSQGIGQVVIREE